jgi:hypothetical protein
MYRKPSDTVVSFEGAIMSKALYRAERCHDLECRRIAATSLSAQIRNRYSRMAEDYSTLAEAEGLETVENTRAAN